MEVSGCDRAELTHVRAALLTRCHQTTTDTETYTQLATLVVICDLLLDDEAALTLNERAECHRELLLDAEQLGVTFMH